jgi:hypothetical protein
MPPMVTTKIIHRFESPDLVMVAFIVMIGLFFCTHMIYGTALFDPSPPKREMKAKE